MKLRGIRPHFFHGETAAFSDESVSNKRRFTQDLTLRKLDGEEIFCPFHSKIKHCEDRTHHSWPIQHDEPLDIASIGPKMTKESGACYSLRGLFQAC